MGRERGPGRRVRVYRTVRSAHLERFRTLEPATVYFLDTSYDFDPDLLEGLDVRPCRSGWDLFRRLVLAEVDELEINEPLMIPGIKAALLAVVAVRTSGLVRARRVSISSYAIENADPFEGLRDQLGWRTPLYRLASQLLVRQLDRLVFGTSQSRDTYEPHLRRFRGTSTLVPALPTRCDRCSSMRSDSDQGPGVVFLGAFNERKGVPRLLEVWPLVRQRRPHAYLRLLGKGPMERDVLEAAERDPSLRVQLDPSRAEIHEALHAAKVATLLSTPRRGWREQVGLPIVEALAHGCEIVCTDQTGLAPWLREHGHHVVPGAAFDPQVTAAALVDALDSTRSHGCVQSALPEVDGRLEADRWMFASGGGPA